MALYVTRLKYRKVNGALRPMQTALLYASSTSELLTAVGACCLDPIHGQTYHAGLWFEICWYDYQRALAFGAYRVNPRVMATCKINIVG